MLAAFFLYASLVNDVRSLLAHNDFAAAERAVRTYEAQAGATPEAAAALSFLARGALGARDFDRADAYADETRKLTDQLLRTRKLDSDPWLPTALGASIEVHAQALAGRGERSEAVAYLRQQAQLFGATSVAERIHKNLNLLRLEGKPAPPVQAADFLGSKPPSLASLRGHPVLLFFWAHWCPDCKAEAPVLADLMRIYAPKGLVLVAPTRLYGYVAGGEPAAPGDEKRYIELVRRQFYAMLGTVPVPLDGSNFETYGASTTPTLVLLDGNGVVRFYHPGAASAAELSEHIQAVLPR
jgi:thiol-disulfide isomerase/thioredoxin